jgi:hypothetical protein
LLAHVTSEYDRYPLDARLCQMHGIEVIAPNRRKRRKAQGGSPSVATCALEDRTTDRVAENFRRLTGLCRRNVTNFLGMVQLGCVLILLRHL